MLFVPHPFLQSPDTAHQPVTTADLATPAPSAASAPMVTTSLTASASHVSATGTSIRFGHQESAIRRQETAWTVFITLRAYFAKSVRKVSSGFRKAGIALRKVMVFSSTGIKQEKDVQGVVVGLGHVDEKALSREGGE